MNQANYFENPFKGIPLSEQVTNPNIIVGRHSYYSGYYHGHSFDDCARYLLPDRDDVDKLIIGNFCSIGTGVAFIMAGNQGHRMDWISSFPFYYTNDEYTKEALDGFIGAGNTEIGHDVWIGGEAIIMPGVKIGHGAVIGTRAIVTKDVEPYTIVVGNPAKPIRKRFTQEQIDILLKIQWWNWPDNLLAQAMERLCSADIESLKQFWQQHCEN
ncbi:type B chloramphenicol O-acetyltransferase [Legionella sp. D16C41]|uniref:type B chloramphenicol O-acetyltransferase n=1 Tax=Legionella sp. D16C41 TaxID=3402688 RepID=UPI003AF99EC1